MMKKMLKVSMVLVLGGTVLLVGADQYKRYAVESGKIDYKITGSGDIMGVKTKTIGKKRVLFDAYGARELNEENQIQKTIMGGNTKIDKTHKITYMDGEMIYSADMESKRIMRMQNPAVAMMQAMGGEKSPLEMGEAMLKKMGGKKVGTDKVLGYTCDVWDAMGTKQCIYKGIPLKVESNIMGIKNTEVATKVEFDISLSDDDFKLPDFPITDMHGNKIDKSKLAEMDAKEQKQAQQGAEEFAAMMGVMAGAAKSAGVKSGEEPTKAQQKSMEDAMMSVMLPRMKQEMLSQEKALRFGKECLAKADTLKEANECSHKMDEMSGEEEEELTEWNPEIKKEALGFIDQGLQVMECVDKAQTMNAVKQCMPQE